MLRTSAVASERDTWRSRGTSGHPPQVCVAQRLQLLDPVSLHEDGNSSSGMVIPWRFMYILRETQLWRPHDT